MDMPVRRERKPWMRPELEVSVESYLCEQVEALDVGALCEKFVSPGRRGPPDRLITWPVIGMHLAETKRPKGGVLESWQIRDHQRRELLGVRVHVLTTRDMVDAYIRTVKIVLGLK